MKNRIMEIIRENIYNVISNDEIYYFDDTEWDEPLIINGKTNEIIETLPTCDENMISIVEINGKLYYSDLGESHYGAIINALKQIHHLKTIKQIEHKFKENIDNICEDIRKRIHWESRFYYKINLLMTDKSDKKHIEQISKDLNIPLNKIKVLYHNKNFETMVINYK